MSEFQTTIDLDESEASATVRYEIEDGNAVLVSVFAADEIYERITGTAREVLVYLDDATLERLESEALAAAADYSKMRRER